MQGASRQGQAPGLGDVTVLIRQHATALECGGKLSLGRSHQKDHPHVRVTTPFNRPHQHLIHAGGDLSQGHLAEGIQQEGTIELGRMPLLTKDHQQFLHDAHGGLVELVLPIRPGQIALGLGPSDQVPDRLRYPETLEKCKQGLDKLSGAHRLIGRSA